MLEGQGEEAPPAPAHPPAPPGCHVPATAPRPLQALTDNPSLVFVRPRWIYSCNEKQKLLPHQLYGVVPQA